MTAEEPEKLYQYLLKFYLPTVPHFRCAIMRRTHSPGAARAVLVLNLPLYEGALIGSAAKYLDEVWPRNGQPRRYCVVARNLGGFLSGACISGEEDALFVAERVQNLTLTNYLCL
jgi:hypothetical protein